MEHSNKAGIKRKVKFAHDVHVIIADDFLKIRS